MLDERSFYIWLNLLDTGSAKKEELLRLYADNPDTLAGLSKNTRIAAFLGEAQFRQAAATFDKRYIADHIAECAKGGVEIAAYCDPEYPARYRRLDFDRPYALYYIGDPALMSGKNIAIVGTRNPSTYGARITKAFSRDLTLAGFTVVSGMAMGADACAHTAALDAGGKTVAVLASGFKHAGPACNAGIYRAITSGGGLAVSEHAPDYAPRPYDFPRRNRLISAMSDAVIVTEAGEKSGSLITAECALAQNIPVFALPGRADDSKAAGCLSLIRAANCAMVYTAEQVLWELGVPAADKKSNSVQLNFMEVKLLDMLDKGELNYDMIFEAMEISFGDLGALLTGMELKGLILSEGGRYRKT